MVTKLKSWRRRSTNWRLANVNRADLARILLVAAVEEVGVAVVMTAGAAVEEEEGVAMMVAKVLAVQ